MVNLMVKIGVIGLFLGVLISCVSVDRSVSFHNFQDNPALRERFVGTWRSEARIGGNYAISVYNADGSMSETSFNSNHRVIATWSGQYKVSSTQLIMRIATNNREAIWNYNFINNDTFSISSGSNNFLYRRTE